jgi:CRP-like cAMP-binding protein
VLSREDFEESVGPLKALVTMSEHRDMLMKIDLLKNLTEVERTNAVRRFMPMTFKKGRVIIKEGMPGDTFFVISEGSVTVTKAATPDFKAEMGPGMFFGELALIHEHDKRSATVTATTEVTCHYLTRRAFQQVVIGEIADMVKATAAERLKAATQLKFKV